MTLLELADGSVRFGGRSPNGHPADGMTAHVDHGGGAVSTILDPSSFENGGLEWALRYGNVEGVRFAAASVVSSYDYLLSGSITQWEAIKRLRLMRRARAAIPQEQTT